MDKKREGERKSETGSKFFINKKIMHARARTQTHTHTHTHTHTLKRRTTSKIIRIHMNTHKYRGV